MLENWVMENFSVAIALVGVIGGAGFTLLMMVYKRGVHVNMMDREIKDLKKRIDNDTQGIKNDLKEAIKQGNKEHAQIRELLTDLIQRVARIEGKLDNKK